MLNLKIVMRYIFTLPLLAALIFLTEREIYAQELIQTEEAHVTIKIPSPGQALQGTILIEIQIDQEEFVSAELSFSYSADKRDTWFLISDWDDVPTGGFNAEWDTTTITDGEYDLRLVVLTEEDQHTTIIPGIRVRNYTPIETNTPFPTNTPAPEDTIAPTMTQTSTITPLPPTVTPLPSNPAHINNRQIASSIGNGALIAISAMTLIGLYQFVLHRRKRET